MSMPSKKFELGRSPRFKQLEPGEECEFSGASIPEEFESEWDTGYGKNKNSKWSFTFTLLKHPHSSYSLSDKGLGVKWETVAEVIRVDVVLNLKDKDFAESWKDPEFIWTLKRREDGSYSLWG
jgi:hypothetical protein